MMSEKTVTKASAQGGEAVKTKTPFADAPVVLSVNHVGKTFKLPTEQATGLKQAFINWTKGIKGYKTQEVLKDIDFEVHQGEFFGIVGRNGGGKSTLLKIISQIYYPNKGSVSVKGKLVPFIELGVGFNPELTGRENVYLNGCLLGFTTEEIDAMYDDIVEFAELEEFMDQKLKNYSSGMQVRLAFSVAIKAQGDILVLDEVLAVGDEAFQRKCDDFFTEVKKDPTKTVILVTHDMGSVKKYCTNAIMIQDGEIVARGNTESVADRYTLANIEAEKKKGEKAAAKVREHGIYPNGLNERCPILRTYAESSAVCKSSDTFRFAVEYQYDEPGDFYLAIALHDIRRGGITFDTGAETFKMKQHGHHTVHFELPLNLFNNGEFRLFTSLRTPSPANPENTDMVAVAVDERACTFVIRDPRNWDYALINNRSLKIAPVGDDVEVVGKVAKIEAEAETEVEIEDEAAAADQTSKTEGK
ncbi:polysaccharide ABC transporter ATP-binding protein [Bifidobacterium tissieri]